MVIAFLDENYAREVKREAGRGLAGLSCPDVVEPSSGTSGRRGDKHTPDSSSLRCVPTLDGAASTRRCDQRRAGWQPSHAHSRKSP